MWKVLYTNAVGSRPQLWLRGSLANGQCFNYSCTIDGEDEVWTGVLGGSVIKLRQKEFDPKDASLSPVHYWSCATDDATLKAALDRLFRAEMDLDALYQTWSSACPRFAGLANAFRGVRLLDQEPWECLVSFIASANNHIPRITKMLASLRAHYGEPLTTDDGEVFHRFPNPQKLRTVASDQALRDLGFGYRAPYLLKTANQLCEGDIEFSRWFDELRDPNISSAEVRKRLSSLAGVGPKVADCVALFSCNRLDVVPVDVHVFNIAKRDYDPRKQLSSFKTVTKPVYDIIAGLFTMRFGAFAGWAHSVLFMSELPAFRTRLSEETQVLMKTYRDEQALARKSVSAGKKIKLQGEENE